MIEALPDTLRYYLGRTRHLLTMLAARPDADRLLAIRIAPDMFDTGFQFAVAIRFAARALCPPSGRAVPEIPGQTDCDNLLGFANQVAELIAPITANQLRQTVQHQAGEAMLEQPADTYICAFALPNMMFHLSMAYAGLRHGGMRVGKADFDGFHAY